MQPVHGREFHRRQAEVCHALSDPTRLSILYALRDGPRNVGQLTGPLDTPQPTISRHLKVLRERRLVLAERNRTSIYYSLADPRVIHALELLRDALTQL